MRHFAKHTIIQKSKKAPNKRGSGNCLCGSKLCQIYNIISLENEFTKTERGDQF